MAEDGVVTLYNGTAITDAKKNSSSFSIKVGIAQMLRGGAIFEVSAVDQAKLAEDAGACAVVIVSDNGRMSDPNLIKEIKRSVSVPVIARSRIGHFVEAQILEALTTDYIDESEALSVADEDNFINKHNFRTPFVCGCRDLGEALRRVREGAAMVRAQGEVAAVSGGDVAATVRSVRAVAAAIRILSNMDEDEVFSFAKRIEAPYDLVAQTKQIGRLPVPEFAAGGIATPADAAMMMQLGCDGVFVCGDVFECADPYSRVRGIVQAVRHYNDSRVLVEASSGVDVGIGGLGLNEDDDNDGGGDRIEEFGHESV